MSRFKIGFGYDVHQLVEGRPLRLGGISIDHSKGAFGHSDADVLLHAIIDALLGAAGLGDIGTHFPPEDQKYKGADSSYSIGNVDTTVVLERPKINVYIPEMRKQIADLLGITIDDVSVKASTNEKMGFVGREEGIAAYAVVLINRK